VRRKLLASTELHTILRLPTGIFPVLSDLAARALLT
jgi:hypothetical protein